MGQLLLVLLARSAASPEMGHVLKAATEEAEELARHHFAAERREGTASMARRAPSSFATPVAPTSPTAPVNLPLAAGAARAAIWSAAQMVAEEVETGPALIPCGNSNGCPGAKEPGGEVAGLSAEVAALVHAAKAKEWTPEVAVPSTTPRHGLDGAFLRREAHRRWQVYLQMAAQRLEATRTGDAVEEYHLLYEAINQIIAGLQLAAEASQGRGAELSEGFSQVAQLLLRLAKVSEGTPFENEDFLIQAQAASALGCGNRPYEDRWCDQRQHRRWLQQDGLHPAMREQLAPNDTEAEHERFQDSWVKYLDLGFAKGLWRSLHDHQSQTFNPSEVDDKNSPHFWQLFPTYIMAKDLREMFTFPATKDVCRACRKLTKIVLEKYHEFKISGFANPKRPDEVNNAFFNWQLTHDEEQKSVEGQQVWPELYQDSTFHELKGFAKLNCLEYLQEIYGPKLSEEDLEQFQLSIWASVTSPERESMGLAFHDHPLALLSGVFYADAGGDVLSERTPTVFADPRGTRAFRYAGQGQRLEPTAPFHRLAYSHAKTGLSLVFPSWLVHGVAPHHGGRDRVVFAYNLHTVPGTTLSSWAKTTL